MKNNLPRLLLLTGIFIILLLPLLNLPPYFSPPDWGKSIAFRLIFLALLAGSAAWALLNRSFALRLGPAKPYLLLLLGLVVVFSISSFFAADPNFAFWGNPMRGGGFVNFSLLTLFGCFLFFSLSLKEWNWAWRTALFTAALVSLFAIFQWQGWFSNIFIEKVSRPMSTLGNDIQLGIFLLLFLFPTLGFFISKKGLWMKVLYALLAFLFLVVIGLTGSRGAYMGLGLGLFFFVTLFPFPKLWQSLVAKLTFFFLMLIPAFMLYYANVQFTPETTRDPNSLYVKNPTFASMVDRFSLAQLVQEPRFSAWQVGWEAVKDRPLLGWGMEHFPFAFDRNYDPQLPNIQYIQNSSNSWWDRGHNVLVDIGVQGGFLGLLLYLSLFGALFWGLQKAKNMEGVSSFQIHSLQAAFLAYFGALLFGFDSFTTYLAFFFLVGYSLYIITRGQAAPAPANVPSSPRLTPVNGIAILIFVLAYVFFAWQYTLKPFLANAEVTAAGKYMRDGKPIPSLTHAEKALKYKGSPIEGYIYAKYFDMMREAKEIPGITPFQFAQKGYSLMREAAGFWPYHTRNWIFLGQLANILLERGAQAQALSTEDVETITQAAHDAFKRAAELSPKHQEIYLEWIKTFIVTKDFEGAKLKAEECAAIDPRTGECAWLKGVAEIALGQTKEAEQDFGIAKFKGFDANSSYALSQLAKAYDAIKNYQKLTEIFEQLAEVTKSPQHYATLAALYKELGQYAKARQAALKVLELDPNSKAEVEEFLKTLP